MNKTATIVIVIIIILLGGWLLLRDRDAIDDTNIATTTNTIIPTTTPPTTNTPPTTGTSTGTSTATSTSSAVKTFTVTGTNFAFAPTTMSVNKGDKVRIAFKNAGGFHDFRIDEFAVATKTLSAGQEETIEFTANKTGSFEYYCSVGNHRAMGMKGTLTVK